MKSAIPFLIRFSSSFLAIFTNYIVAKSLGSSIYGIYSGMLSFTFIINLLTDWGFNNYGSQMLAQLSTIEEKGYFIKQVLQFKLFLSIFLTLCYIILSIFILQNSFYYLLGIPVVLFSFLQPEWICRGTMLPNLGSYRQLVFAILSIVCFAILFFLKAQSALFFLFYSFNTILSFGIIIYFLGKRISFLELKKIKLQLPSSEIINKTSVYFIGYLLNNFIYMLGILMLTFFTASINVGIYASYYNLFSTLVAPVVITYGLFAPKFHVSLIPDFYKDYFVVIISILACGLVFYVNGNFFYKIFYPASKGFVFNNRINLLAASVFFMYCLENMFVVKYIIDSKPKVYFITNLIALVIGLCCYIYLILEKEINIESCFVVLILMQFTMLFRSVYMSLSTVKYLNNIKIFTIIALIIALILLQYFSESFIYIGGISAAIIVLSSYNAAKILKRLY